MLFGADFQPMTLVVSLDIGEEPQYLQSISGENFAKKGLALENAFA